MRGAPELLPVLAEGVRGRGPDGLAALTAVRRTRSRRRAPQGHRDGPATRAALVAAEVACVGLVA